jgi:hypothetical protein
MAYQSPVLRTLDYGYSSGRLDRREFVRALTAATMLAGFGGSTASALAAAGRRAEELDALATPPDLRQYLR